MLHHLKALMEEVLYKVFLDLKKPCKALDRERCMEILVGIQHRTTDKGGDLSLLGPPLDGGTGEAILQRPIPRFAWG